MLLFVAVTTLAAQTVPHEYDVKAAYLMNFARFIDWPSETLRPASSIMVAIIGSDPSAGHFDRAMKNQVINGHPVRVSHPAREDDLSAYHIVFIASSEEPRLDQILRDVRGRSILTVSDIDRFTLRGGIIGFAMVGNRVRFDINRRPASEAKLVISSKLLAVARTVRDGVGQ